MLPYIIMIAEFIIIIYAAKIIKTNLIDNKKITNATTLYQTKPFMTDCEYNFYRTLKELEDRYAIVPQVNLASIIKKVNNDRYYNELFRNIDFAIFTKDYRKILLLIELNDNTHNNPNRKDRDLKVKDICQKAGIKLMTFHTNMPNLPSYVIKRICNEIEKKNEPIEFNQ